jgi:hypothetical protein
MLPLLKVVHYACDATLTASMSTHSVQMLRNESLTVWIWVVEPSLFSHCAAPFRNPCLIRSLLHR